MSGCDLTALFFRFLFAKSASPPAADCAAAGRGSAPPARGTDRELLPTDTPSPPRPRSHSDAGRVALQCPKAGAAVGRARTPVVALAPRAHSSSTAGRGTTGGVCTRAARAETRGCVDPGATPGAHPPTGSDHSCTCRGGGARQWRPVTPVVERPRGGSRRTAHCQRHTPTCRTTSPVAQDARRWQNHCHPHPRRRMPARRPPRPLPPSPPPLAAVAGWEPTTTAAAIPSSAGRARRAPPRGAAWCLRRGWRHAPAAKGRPAGPTPSLRPAQGRSRPTTRGLLQCRRRRYPWVTQSCPQRPTPSPPPTLTPPPPLLPRATAAFNVRRRPPPFPPARQLLPPSTPTRRPPWLPHWRPRIVLTARSLTLRVPSAHSNFCGKVRSIARTYL